MTYALQAFGCVLACGFLAEDSKVITDFTVNQVVTLTEAQSLI